MNFVLYYFELQYSQIILQLQFHSLLVGLTSDQESLDR